MNRTPLALLVTALVFTTLLESSLSRSADAIPGQSPWLMSQSRPTRAPVKITFNPPSRGAPPATVGLGSRGDCLETRDRALTALVPKRANDVSSESVPLGLTTAVYPTIFVYVPAYHSSAQALSLRVMRVTGDDQEVELYTQTFAIPATAGITGLHPTQPSLPPLEVGQQYHWYVSMVCSSIDQSGNAVVDGWIERIEPDAALSGELEQATPIDRAVLYGQTGIWHDTLLTLAELRRAQPTDPSLRETWQELLQSVGLEAIAQAPVLEYGQPLN